MDWQTQPHESDLIMLGEFLSRDPDGPIQNAEALDGFFAALICCQDPIGPDEFMPILLNIGPQDDITHFANEREAKQFSKLVAEHWHRVSHQIIDEEYVPIVLVDEDGKFRANDWANGFLEGIELRSKLWSKLLRDEKEGDFMFPIWVLAYENRENSKFRSFDEPVTDKEREKLHLAAGYCVIEMYRYFSEQRNR